MTRTRILVADPLRAAAFLSRERALVISEFTVKRHVQNILQKLELPLRRAAATLYGTAFGSEEAAVAAPRMA
jgi:hypothetical protein